jgi:hypothetical protein
VALLDVQHMCSTLAANKPDTKGLIVDCGTHRHIIILLALLQAGFWTMHTALKHIIGCGGQPCSLPLLCMCVHILGKPAYCAGQLPMC